MSKINGISLPPNTSTVVQPCFEFGQAIDQFFGMTASGQLRNLMEEVGFVNVTESWKRIPIEASNDLRRGTLKRILDKIDAMVHMSVEY
jgi:hypothetical protein